MPCVNRPPPNCAFRSASIVRRDPTTPPADAAYVVCVRARVYVERGGGIRELRQGTPTPRPPACPPCLKRRCRTFAAGRGSGYTWSAGTDRDEDEEADEDRADEDEAVEEAVEDAVYEADADDDPEG